MITPNQFIEKFQRALEVTRNKKSLIDNELDTIEYFLNSIEKEVKKDTKQEHVEREVSFSHSFDSFTNVFKLAIFNYNILKEVQIEIDESGTFIIDKNNLEQSWLNQNTYDDTILFIKYYNWLKKQSKTKKRENFTDLTVEQRFLALHYLKFDISTFPQTQSAIILSQILNIGTENIRKNLSSIQNDEEKKLHTPKNLTTLIKLFDTKGFKKLSERIKRDLSSIK